jgi:hypothetical protein
VPAHVYESPQSLLVPHDHDRQIENGACKVVAHLGNLGSPAHVLPGAQEDPLPFEVRYRRVRVPMGRKGEPAVQVTSQDGDLRISRCSLCHDRSPFTVRISGLLDLQLHL